MSQACPTCGRPRSTSEMMALLEQQVKERIAVKQHEWCACVDQTSEAQRSRIDVMVAEAMGDFDDEDD